MKKIFYPILILLLFNSTIIVNSNLFSVFSFNKNTPYSFPQEQKEWTIMLYLCADTRDTNVTGTNNNNSHIANAIVQAYRDIIEVINPGSESEINIIALMDYPTDMNHPLGYTILTSLEYDNEIILDDQLGSKNMGSGYTLSEFITYCKTNFPANYYSLLLSDHGRGYAGFCYDYHAPHPSWEYALGDCLTVEEIGDAINTAGGDIDVLFLDTCLGGSFEVLWELKGLVKYMVAGETSQKLRALYHPLDILYNFTRSSNLTPLTLAQFGFDSAVDPKLVPYDPYYSPWWKTVSIYDLTKFYGSPTTGRPSFIAVFEDFCDMLLDEITLNSYAKDIFRQLRNNIHYHDTLFHENSMMIDLKHFIENVLYYNASFVVNQNYIINYGSTLLELLTPGEDKIILEEFHRPFTTYENVTSASICFPNTRDMYQEFLYRNFYENLEISLSTTWEDFIFTVYPPPDDPFLHLPIPEFYELNLGLIDPCIGLHVFLEHEDLIQPLHIGRTSIENDYSMDIELGYPGAEYVDDLLWGTTMIRIPVNDLAGLGNNIQNEISFESIKVVINGSSTPSATQKVNLTVKHVKNNETLWQDTQISNIEVGQDLACEISIIDDEWTDLEIIRTTKPAFIGIQKPIIMISISISIPMIILIIYRKKRNN